MFEFSLSLSLSFGAHWVASNLYLAFGIFETCILMLVCLWEELMRRLLYALCVQIHFLWIFYTIFFIYILINKEVSLFLCVRVCVCVSERECVRVCVCVFVCVRARAWTLWFGWIYWDGTWSKGFLRPEGGMTIEPGGMVMKVSSKGLVSNWIFNVLSTKQGHLRTVKLGS